MHVAIVSRNLLQSMRDDALSNWASAPKGSIRRAFWACFIEIDGRIADRDFWPMRGFWPLTLPLLPEIDCVVETLIPGELAERFTRETDCGYRNYALVLGRWRFIFSITR
jgi:hypothetical protein